VTGTNFHRMSLMHLLLMRSRIVWTRIGRTLGMDIKGSACWSPSSYKCKYKYEGSCRHSRCVTVCQASHQHSRHGRRQTCNRSRQSTVRQQQQPRHRPTRSKYYNSQRPPADQQWEEPGQLTSSLTYHWMSEHTSHA